jgi:hypothetical protein
MKKIKITQEQYNVMLKKLNESTGVKGGFNRVDKTFTGEFRKIKENGASILKKTHVPGGNKKFKPNPLPDSLKENIFSPELHQAIHNLIENIWLNPSQKHLDKFFVENGITWGDIISYLTGVGVVGVLSGGIYKIKNLFNRKFSNDPSKKMIEKKEEIEKITDKIEKDPIAPWSKNKLKDPKGQQLMNPEMDEAYYNVEPHPDSPEAKYSKKEPEVYVSKKPKMFKTIAMNMEIAILDGPDGKYVLYYDEIPREELPNTSYELNDEDITSYVNDNIKNISKENFIKLDDELKNDLLDIYQKDRNIVKALNDSDKDSMDAVDETTGASSSGSFTGLFSPQNKNMSSENSPSKQIGEIINDEEELFGLKKENKNNKKDKKALVKETTAAAGGTPQSSSTGQYTQPAIWAKDKKNWAGNKKTQYPNGEMVEFDPCVRLNNNKAAQNGKCSQGAVDNVVKTHKTKDSVISKNIYTEIAKITGRNVEDIQKVIESKLNNNKSL